MKKIISIIVMSILLFGCDNNLDNKMTSLRKELSYRDTEFGMLLYKKAVLTWCVDNNVPIDPDSIDIIYEGFLCEYTNK